MRKRLIKPLVALLLISLIVSTAAMIGSVVACQKERVHGREQKCKCVIDLSAACRKEWMHKHAQERRLVIRCLINLSREISKLPDDAFENPENARCQRKVLRWKVWVVVRQVIVGAYEGAINKLDNDIRGRIEKWIVDPWKTGLIEKVDSIIDLIKMLCKDLEPPTIVGVLRCPETPNYDESVTIITNVFDKRSGVESVILSYSVNLNNWVNLTMNPVAGFYVAEIPAQPYNASVSYKVYAYDKAGNSAVSDTYSYVVIDSHPPVISWVERSPISPNYNDTVSVTASVTEPEEASGVQLVILSYSDGVTWTNKTMTLKEETIYEGSIPALPSGTTVEYMVYASDNAENWCFSSTYSYTVGAPAPIHDIAIIDVVSSPSTVKVGGTVAINVTVLNEGTVTGAFNVSVYYNLTPLETRTLVLDAGSETTQNFTWVTTSEGVYLIWAEVHPLPGETDVADNIFVDGTVTVSSLQPPVASFTFSPTSLYTGQNVTFDASLSYDPDGTIVSYTWSFGDGTTGNGKIVTHSYADNGTYAVELTVVDNDGLTDIESESITVLNRPPVASFTESATSVSTGTVIHFNASESRDPDGKIVTYFWDFGDGTNGTGVTVDHAYADDGSYIVTLTVTDDDGSTATAVAVKTISNRSPTASFTENATAAYRGEAIRFDASASFDPDGYITSYFWNFGDGTNATGVVVDHTYVNDGSYTVTLVITDDDGLIAIATAKKVVLNHPPFASFTENATTIQTGVVIQFEASASYDPDGTIVSYFWTFGDGTNATGIIVTHAYADDDTYLVTLTVTDNDGATASSTATKIVLNRPPIASFTESAITVFAGEVIQFNASASYDPDGSIVSYTWGFGDDNITTTSVPTINHTYTTLGTYNVTLTVTDDDGLTDGEVKTFAVEAAPWPLSLIVATTLLIAAATAAAIYLIIRWRRKSKASVPLNLP